MVLEGMKDFAVLEAPDPNSTPPERRPGRVGGTLKTPARAGPAPRTPANGGVMPLRNWPAPLPIAASLKRAPAASLRTQITPPTSGVFGLPFHLLFLASRERYLDRLGHLDHRVPTIRAAEV
jgi:hypothetical protein